MKTNPYVYDSFKLNYQNIELRATWYLKRNFRVLKTGNFIVLMVRKLKCYKRFKIIFNTEQEFFKIVRKYLLLKRE